MTEHPENPRFWTQPPSSAAWTRPESSSFRRFIGGSPTAVLLKLVTVSFIVGALLMWLRISPADVLAEIQTLTQQLWTYGFRSLHDFGGYLMAGAVVVVPTWLVIRILSYRGR